MRLLQLIFLASFSLAAFRSYAAPGDTLKVQTFTFGSKQDSVFFFPTAGKEYRKVLMYYTLKCNPAQTPACGEWDYLTYTYLYKKRDTVEDRFEIARFITPYGNGLSLGNGFTWIFDVTDYATLLQDSVRLTAGNWQELLDMKFVFIEGKPVRKVRRIKTIWSEHIPYTSGIANQWAINIPDLSTQLRMKVRVTGHGFGGNENCAEFCAKTHTLTSGGLDFIWSKLVWRDNCGQNPVFPQGGTWVYNRANWCPGAEVETYDVDIKISKAEYNAGFMSLQYLIPDYTWNGQGSQPYYAMEAQLVELEAPEAKTDAGIEEIIRPSTNPVHSRLNPVCAVPRVVIKNNGADTLKTLRITYGIPGGPVNWYDWKGSLGFQEKATVDLNPVADWIGANYPRFQVVISNPNGKPDEYAHDDTAFSFIPTAQLLPYKIIVYLKTNNVPEQNEYTITDAYGKVWTTRKDFAANTVYRDTFTLPNGCYTFLLKDKGENGLNWWAAPDEGTGVIRIQNDKGNILKSFKADFGSEVLFNFSTGWTMSLPEAEAPRELLVYPNPATSQLFIDMASLPRENGTLQVVSSIGQEILSREINPAAEPITRLNLNDVSTGIYIVRFATESGVYSSRFLKK